MANDWKQIACGYGHSLAIKNNGTLWAWGYNYLGQVGDGSTADKSSPTQIAGTWQQVTAGHSHTLAIKSDGTLWTWGWNFYGQLGIGSTNTNGHDYPDNPSQVTDATWQQIAGGDYHTIGVKTDGTLWVCGWSLYGQLGLGDTTDRLTPTLVEK